MNRAIIVHELRAGYISLIEFEIWRIQETAMARNLNLKHLIRFFDYDRICELLLCVVTRNLFSIFEMQQNAAFCVLLNLKKNPSPTAFSLSRVGMYGLLYNPMGKLKFRTLMLITSKWIIIDIKFDIMIGHSAADTFMSHGKKGEYNNNYLKSHCNL
jgi:hypothetical protein